MWLLHVIVLTSRSSASKDMVITRNRLSSYCFISCFFVVVFTLVFRAYFREYCITAPCACKGSISASSICHLFRYILVVWYIGRPLAAFQEYASCSFARPPLAALVAYSIDIHSSLLGRTCSQWIGGSWLPVSVTQTRCITIINSQWHRHGIVQ